MDEREESVRLEILAAFGALLKQTATAKQAELASGARNKRKRTEEMDDDSGPEDRLVILPRIELIPDDQCYVVTAVIPSSSTPSCAQAAEQ